MGVETIGKNTVVGINYRLTVSDGNEVDTTEGRGPLEYLHGHANIIPGLEKALEGARVDDEFDIDYFHDGLVPPFCRRRKIGETAGDCWSGGQSLRNDNCLDTRQTSAWKFQTSVPVHTGIHRTLYARCLCVVPARVFLEKDLSLIHI